MKVQNYTQFAIRLVVGLIFVIAGFSKVMAIEGITGLLTSVGIPLAVFFAWIVAIVELVGGVFLILGLFDKITASLLSFVMLVAVLTVHLSQGWGDLRYPLLLLVVTAHFIMAKGENGLIKCIKEVM